MEASEIAALATLASAVSGGIGYLIGMVIKGKKDLRAEARLDDEKAREDARKSREEAREAERKGREEALGEWKAIVTKLEEDIAEEKRENKGLRVQLHALRDKQHADVLSIYAKQLVCERENAELKGEIRLLQSSVARLQTTVGHAQAATIPCLIIAETDGTIRDVSPVSGPLLEWLPKELIGQNLAVIVPPEDVERHREALKKLAASGIPPWTERVILGEALTKTGRRVKVSVRVKGWQSGGGHWLLSGEISERLTDGK